MTPSANTPDPETSTAMRLLPVWVLALFVTIAAVVLGIYGSLSQVHWQTVYKQPAVLANPELPEQRALDFKRLTEYDVVDAAGGIYQIPVERAMAQVVHRADKPEGAVIAPPVSAVLPEPSFAPAPAATP